MLWMPSWGGMINGLLTLRGAWHKVRRGSGAQVLRRRRSRSTACRRSRGRCSSIKSVNALAHYTDWIIAHVHTGALGWNGFMTFGMIYWLLPRLFQTQLYCKKLADVHFWLATFGILLYVVAIYSAGHHAGPDVARVRRDRAPRSIPTSSRPSMRADADVLDARASAARCTSSGMLLFGCNILMTWRRRPATYDEPVIQAAPLLARAPTPRRRRRGRPARSARFVRPRLAPHVGRAAGCTFTRAGVLVAVVVASLFEIIPTFLIRSNVPTIASVQAVHAARARRPRHLHPRGLLQLPLADDPPVPLRDRALRRVLEAGRVRLRPSVPVGLAPHRPGPRARGRQVPRPLARAAHARIRASITARSIMPAYPHLLTRRPRLRRRSRSAST